MTTLLNCESSYLASVFWSHCKQTTAGLSRPDHLKSCCCTQMLRSVWLWAAVTVVYRPHAIQHRNSVSTRETWESGGVNSVRHYRKRSPSAESPCASGEKKGVVTWGSWFCFVRGSLCVGCGELLGECMRLTGSSVNNETLPGCLSWHHIRFLQSLSQPANHRQMRLFTSLPTVSWGRWRDARIKYKNVY